MSPSRGIDRLGRPSLAPIYFRFSIDSIGGTNCRISANAKLVSLVGGT